MDIVLNQGIYNNLEGKLLNAVNNFRLMNMEKSLSEMIDKFSSQGSLNYLGELNKNDLMF